MDCSMFGGIAFIGKVPLILTDISQPDAEKEVTEIIISGGTT